MKKTIALSRKSKIFKKKLVASYIKRAAVEFLRMIVDGRIEEAYLKHVFIRGKHHNPYFPAGFPALRDAMIENHFKFPEKKFTIHHVLKDGDLVAAHLRVELRPGGPDIAVVHLFRFRNKKIVEMWDCAHVIPADSPNADGVF